ncbi:hypothetical protein JL193_12965 [Polaribacter batillariae]|uniref:Uncharacterized protein n=1 Tax=Polaribacter batillariae TaxID=2808900 RepID=A0ABX7SS02_9FLAO|nr:hypothetical protein [Polaribacter batillariae]QTD37027.1 hypothetical protein JL193_12965 [Polaribacter batillariae]
MSFKNLLKILFHFFLFLWLTLLTQIGGLIYILSRSLISTKKKKHLIKRFSIFVLLYVTSTFLIVPSIAPFFGRVKIEDSHNLTTHNFVTKLCNRNYVTPKLHDVLTNVSLKVNKEYPDIKVMYLDANFPFFDGFPLLPHLSHNDGKKIDISFVYEDDRGKITNLKPSNSGYGIFEEPKSGEANQTKKCKENGYWQYDFTKYFTFGNPYKNLKISEKATKTIIHIILKNNNVNKLFIEPHLKIRLNLKDKRIRFHGCQAVRHDDHIHFQIQ